MTRTEKLESSHAELTRAIEALTTGEDWARMLETAGRFHQYSASNVFLIMMQKENATRVAGYKTWQKVGRQVRKGEKGIRILAPCKYKVTGEDGEPDSFRIGGFTTVSVFDVSQTDGEPLADVRPALVTGDGPDGMWHALTAQVEATGYTVARVDPATLNGANGRSAPASKSVQVRDDVDGAQACKTLAHELAHLLLGHVDSLANYTACRGVSEVEAESVAFLVCQSASMATDGYSFPYLARWANGDADVVRKTADRVIKVAKTIGEALENTPELASV